MKKYTAILVAIMALAVVGCAGSKQHVPYEKIKTGYTDSYDLWCMYRGHFQYMYLQEIVIGKREELSTEAGRAMREYASWQSDDGGQRVRAEVAELGLAYRLYNGEIEEAREIIKRFNLPKNRVSDVAWGVGLKIISDNPTANQEKVKLLAEEFDFSVEEVIKKEVEIREYRQKQE